MSLESFLVEEVAPWEEKLHAKDPLPKALVLVAFRKPFPSFVGEDLKIYGPFKPGDVANLPKIVAVVLLKRGVVEEVCQDESDG